MSTANRGIYIGPPWFKIAVHSIFWLAKSGGVVSSAMVASQVDSHATFMRRVLQVLAAEGIVESRGGREGGYMLSRCPNEITLGDIYVAVNKETGEPDHNSDCGATGERVDLELEKILFESEQQTIQYLRQFTVADVMNRVNFYSS